MAAERKASTRLTKATWGLVIVTLLLGARNRLARMGNSQR